jgi:hypothetical protein
MIGIWYFVIYALIILGLWAFEKSRNFLKTNLPEVITATSAYIYLLSDIKSQSDDILISSLKWKECNLFLIITGVIVFFIGLYIGYRKNQQNLTLNNLKSDLAIQKANNQKIKDEYYSLCSNYIKEIFEPFYFSADKCSSRISIYKHQGTHFTLLGRCSDNPIYNKKGLQTYPDTEGFIALGWQNGTYKIHDVPEWKHKGATYKKFMKETCNIQDDRLNKLTMHSRSFYVRRLENPNSTNPHGIIVFEKMSKDEIDSQKIEEIFSTHKVQIISLMKSMKTLDKT